jgi:cytochrome c-type biogenesis protein CcmH/NrfG
MYSSTGSEPRETAAEALGMTLELGRAAARLAGEEADVGRLETARTILEGLVITNPYDAAGWALLASVERRRGRSLAARLCAGIAHRLAPDDRQVRLVRAEALLTDADQRAAARAELRALAAGGDAVATRSRALTTAMGG